MKLASTVVAVAAALAFAAPATAATVISSSSAILSFNQSDPGLVINAAPLSFSVTLDNQFDSATTPVLTIGTPEGTVNTNFLSLFGEDTAPKAISALFTFDSPLNTTGSPVTGTTFGFIRPLTTCGVVAGGCGRVEWSDTPTIFSFGNGGSFSLLLSDAEFATPGGLFGTPASVNVLGTFTLLNSGVPEPATWAMMIVGIGLLGGAMRRRRVTVAYA